MSKAKKTTAGKWRYFTPNDPQSRVIWRHNGKKEEWASTLTDFAWESMSPPASKLAWFIDEVKAGHKLEHATESSARIYTSLVKVARAHAGLPPVQPTDEKARISELEQALRDVQAILNKVLNEKAGAR